VSLRRPPRMTQGRPGAGCSCPADRIVLYRDKDETTTGVVMMSIAFNTSSVSSLSNLPANGVGTNCSETGVLGPSSCARLSLWVVPVRLTRNLGWCRCCPAAAAVSGASVPNKAKLARSGMCESPPGAPGFGPSQSYAYRGCENRRRRVHGRGPRALHLTWPQPYYPAAFGHGAYT
jgi:hypothetical protein